MSDPVLVSNDNSALLQNLASNRVTDAFSYSIPQNYPSYSRSVIRVAPDQKGFSTTSRWRIPKAGLLKNMWIRWEISAIDLYQDTSTSYLKYVNYLGCMMCDGQGVQLISKNKVLTTIHPHYMIGRIEDMESGKKECLEQVVLKDQVDSDEIRLVGASPAAAGTQQGTLRVYTPIGDFIGIGDSPRNWLDTVFLEALEIKLTTRAVGDLFNGSAGAQSANDLANTSTGTVSLGELVCEFIHPDPEYMSLVRNANFGEGVMSYLTHTSQEEARVTKTPSDDTETERTITADIKTPNVMTRIYFAVLKDVADSNHKVSDENDFVPVERVELKANGRTLYDYHADELQFLANRGYGRSATALASHISELALNQNCYCLNFSADGQSRDYQSGAVSGRELNNCQLVVYLADNEETESIQSRKYTLVVNPECLAVWQVSADTGVVDRGLDV